MINNNINIKNKPLYNISIEGCNFNTRLNYNINTDHIGIYSSFSYRDPDKRKQYQNQYYKNNKDEISKRGKQYREDNKDKISKMNKEYRKNNIDKVKKYQIEYRENNKNKIKKLNKQYREDNIDKVKQYNKEYKIKNRNPNRIKIDSEEYKIMISCRNQGIPIKNFNGFLTEQKYCEKFNESLKRKIRDQYNNCDYLSGLHTSICNKNRNLDVHHVNYDKSCGCDGNRCKLIPLSRINHVRTNYKRFFWNKLFIYALEYDKEYYET